MKPARPNHPAIHLFKYLSKCLALSSSLLLLSNCDKNDTHAPDLANTNNELGLIQVGSKLSHEINIDGNRLQRLELQLVSERSYASLSIFSDGQLIADNLDLAKQGLNTLNTIIKLPHLGQQTLSFVARSGNIELKQFKLIDANDIKVPSFQDISAEANFNTEISYKYGGPSVADVDNDGDYDFILNNHNYISPQWVENLGDGKVKVEPIYPSAQDYHGTALGDYDRDGDMDLMLAFGGGSGSNPSSYALLNNDNGHFSNVAPELGITAAVRGRSPRWIDLDLDGDLDLALFNAKTPNNNGPQQLFYRNDGTQGFKLVHIENLEMTDAERVLITDFNNDGLSDFITYTPYASLKIWQNEGQFKFTDVSNNYLKGALSDIEDVIAVTDVDVNNDGLTDLYLARGRSHYKLSRKSIDFNPLSKKLDIRDDGEVGSSLIEFKASDSIRLSDMELVYRLYDGGFAIFLGENKERHIVKAKGFQPRQLPDEMRNAENELTITAESARGWPKKRETNGMYIGYLGNNQWKAEWVRNETMYWTISFSIDGIDSVNYDWQANNRNLQDILLINQGTHFSDASKQWNLPKGGNHVGVSHADFNNDGWQDIFVYRYGFLKERIDDLLLINNGHGYFELLTRHGARDDQDPGHGDMGQAFDFDLDGKVDLLNGSEEEGRWYIYKNTSENTGNYLLLEIGPSPKDKVDTYSAVVELETASGKHIRQRVASSGEVFSQSLLNIMHFGLAKEQSAKRILIHWRNGEELVLRDLKANQIYSTKTSAH